MGNPYESPRATTDKHTAASGKPAVSRWPISIYFLLALFSWTVLMAFINLVQEDSGSRGSQDLSSIFFCVMLAGFSGLSQVPGLGIAAWRWKGSANSVLPVLFASYIIAFTGAAAFTAFALQTEPSDSMNSAAHMHIFLVPVLHIALSIILYFIAFLFTMVCVAYSRYRGRRLDLTGRVNDSATGSEDVVVNE